MKFTDTNGQPDAGQIKEKGLFELLAQVSYSPFQDIYAAHLDDFY